MFRRRQFIVVGCGGFGKEVLWTAQNFNAVSPTYEIIGYCDDDPTKKGQVIYGHPVLGAPEAVDARLAEKPCFICSIGDNTARARVVGRVLALGWEPVTIIDPSAIVASDVVVGAGTYVGARSILCPNANIGRHVIVNNMATIGHDSRLGDFTQVSPGGRVSGASVMEEGALLGSNAVISQLKKVGRYATLGACSFAMSNIPDYATAVGIPARVTFRRNPEGEA
jgi:sugar O-acyltransferase (sialic acid O-acetyltransferase NeuD family)